MAVFIARTCFPDVNRWNKFQAGAAVKKLWFKCTIGFCARFDFSATPSEGAKCIDVSTTFTIHAYTIHKTYLQLKKK